MASKAKSRWADDEEDAATEAALKKQKEEKRRTKAEKARKLEEEKLARAAQAQAEAARTPARQKDDDNTDDRPTKRRKLTPERDPGPHGVTTQRAGDSTRPSESRLLRFNSGAWTKSRSVEAFDKLNDIEEGTYGWVARAREIATGRVVALKRLKLDGGDRNGLPVTGLREIQVLRDCDHRNIVKLHEVVVGDDNSKIDSIFLVLEFVEHDLRTLLQDMPQPFLPSEVKRLVLQLASGVAYLHTNWILHRDLKTSNLLLNNRGRLKIADFGMARYVGDPPPKLTQLVVTLWYRAPELLLGAREYGAAVDTWSMGCIFAELLARDPVLQGSNEVDQLGKIFELCGVPTEESWPGFRRLPNARGLKLPKTQVAVGSIIRARFPFLTTAGCSLLSSLLALNPDDRPSAAETLQHEYFAQDPKPKAEGMFPTFPSKAGQEKRRRHEPHAPGRGEAAELGAADFSGIFQGREMEERGGGFTLRMV